jgi:cobalamin biosynthetic protein CobC
MSGAFTHHGGRIADACARFGGAPEDWLDLSTGINPVPWQPPPALAIDWRGLPEAQALARLEARAAGHFGVAPDLCMALPGSETALRLLARVLDLPGRTPPLAYGTYRDAFVPGAALASGEDPPPRATAIVLGNPNNPDGTVLAHARALALLAHQEAHGGWLIVDEAFADCAPDASLAALVAPQRRLIVLRSFGKFFGLAGLRLGFVIAPEGVLAALRHLLGDWPVHAAALALGTVAYADRAWIADTRQALPRRAAALDRVLRRHGLSPEGACPLFRLVRTRDAGRLFATLAGRRILTRPFADHPDLLRLGLPADDAERARLDAALARGQADG